MSLVDYFVRALELQTQRVLGLRNGTCVPETGFAVAKIFAEGGLGLQNGFTEGALFCSKTSISQRGVLGCEMVS